MDPSAKSDRAPRTVREGSEADSPFEIIEEAGSGGMGTVYRARDRETGSPLAVKVLRETSGDITRFALEADVLSKLEHSSIVRYAYHGLTKDNHPYLAMEWLEGESLEARLRRGVLSNEETLRIAHTIAEALVVAHAAGVVHRDLKPSNVFLTKDGVVKLVDFGVAKSFEVEGLTRTGDAIGTPGYMSPEQARGAKIDARSDLFSLGCVIFRCLGGRRPFQGVDLMAYATALALEDAPPLREVAPHASQTLEALVAELLRKDPAARPANAAVVRDRLSELLAGAGTGGVGTPDTLPADVSTHAGRPMRRLSDQLASPQASPKEVDGSKRKSPLGAIALGALAVAAIGAVALQREIATGPAPKPSSTIASHRVDAGLTPSGKNASNGAADAAATTSPDAAIGAIALEPPLGLDDRVGLEEACREQSKALARVQRPDGSFAADARSEPTGGETAHALYALASARHACSGVDVTPIASGARALSSLRVDDGWAGPAPLKTAGKIRAETPANAWALLALSAAARETADWSLATAISQARADLLRGKTADGGFRQLSKSAEEASAYATMLAAWALMETDDADAGSLSSDALGAVVWLERQLVTGVEAVRAHGLIEQIAWVLARAERRASGGEPRAAALRLGTKSIIDDCRIDIGERVTCKRPISDIARIDLGGFINGKPRTDRGSRVVVYWHPWSTASSFEIARSPELSLGDESLPAVSAISRWGTSELRRTSETIASSPAPKLADYVLAVSALLAPP